MARARGKHNQVRATTPVGQEARANRLRLATYRTGRAADVVTEAQNERAGHTFSGAERTDATLRPDADPTTRRASRRAR